MKNQDNQNKKADAKVPAKNTEQNQGHAIKRTGSTTQGGPDYGQGSSYLGSDSYQQGAKKNEGANYDNKNTPEQNPQTDNPQQAGYSPEPEKQETKKEQENMHNERNPNELNADRQVPPPNEGAGKTEGKKK